MRLMTRLRVPTIWLDAVDGWWARRKLPRLQQQIIQGEELAVLDVGNDIELTLHIRGSRIDEVIESKAQFVAAHRARAAPA
jgi:hypothetical protein